MTIIIFVILIIIDQLWDSRNRALCMKQNISGSCNVWYYKNGWKLVHEILSDEQYETDLSWTEQLRMSWHLWGTQALAQTITQGLRRNKVDTTSFPESSLPDWTLRGKAGGGFLNFLGISEERSAFEISLSDPIPVTKLSTISQLVMTSPHS